MTLYVEAVTTCPAVVLARARGWVLQELVVNFEHCGLEGRLPRAGAMQGVGDT